MQNNNCKNQILPVFPQDKAFIIYLEKFFDASDVNTWKDRLKELVFSITFESEQSRNATRRNIANMVNSCSELIKLWHFIDSIKNVVSPDLCIVFEKNIKKAPVPRVVGEIECQLGQWISYEKCYIDVDEILQSTKTLRTVLKFVSWAWDFYNSVITLKWEGACNENN